MSIAGVKPQRAQDLDRLTDARLFKEFSYINGEWCAASTGETITVTNPANNGWIGSVPAMSADEAAGTATVAATAFGHWSALLPQQRAAILHRWFALVCEHKEDLAVLMTLEQGKPLSEARGEIDYGASFIEFFSEEAKRPDIMGVTSHLPDAEMEVWLEPVGVAALITPWNFPIAMITRKAAAALAIGCTVVIHPSRETPFCALALAVLADRAGIPAGVFNVVTGEPAEIAGTWSRDTRVRALSFTGSTEIGRLLYSQCSSSIKRLSLELGGHAPFIVFADANIDKAVDEAIKAKFATSGQDCLAANRFLIERPVYDEFCESFVGKTRTLSVDCGLNDPDIGPLMNNAAVEKQQSHISDALSKGGRLLCGGDVLESLGPLFFAPTVLADVS
ncbi:MAG: aldehyde dehydrogenase family protein, partial [Sneathiella sp.]|nr:aldehyde dehydrogenase family protein [Sneathiella sp.]